MVLLDSLYINNGGGKILLDYLVKECEKSNLDIFYLFDERCKESFKEVPSHRKIFMKASLTKRLLYYKRNKDSYSVVLCFGNLPPSIKVNAKVYTYFHQPLFLDTPSDIKIKQKLILSLKVKILNFLKPNTDYWVVQSELIRNKLAEKYNLRTNSILNLPFYESTINKNQNINTQIPYSYIYVSNSTPHKNHIRLIRAFCEFYDIHKKGELTLTVPLGNQEINKLLFDKRIDGYPITNLGFVDRFIIIKAYYQHQYLIFPSLAESFGLGLVEAIECGCKVIGADLPYTYEVCKPSIIFDPYSVKSIKDAFESSLEHDVSNTEMKINNNIDTVLELLK